MAEEVGVGFVRLVPSMRGFARKAEREMRSALAGPSRRAGEDSGKGFGDGAEQSMNDRMSGVGRKIMRGFGKELSVTAKPTAKTVATAFSGQFIASVAAGIASGVGKIAHGLASIAALLPAAALAGAAAFGALKVAVSGVGDALSAGLTGDTEKFNEALKGLSPSAREFAREVVSLRGRLDGLKASVQESFFAPLTDQVRPLARLYLPATQRLLSSIAQGFGRAGNQAAFFLRTPGAVRKLTEAFRNVGIAVRNIVGPLGRLPDILLPLITVGASFLPRLTNGFGDATNRLASFMAEAERTGRLEGFIQRGLDKLRSLWETAKQVGRIFGDIGSIASTVFGGLGGQTGGVLDSLEGLTGRLKAFLATAEGSELAQQMFATFRAASDALLGTLQRLGGMLGRTFGPILPDILEFVEAFADLKAAVLDTALDALEPILAGVADVLSGAVLPALTGLANWLADNRPVLQGIGIAIATLLVPAFVSWAISAGAAAIATLAAMAPIILIGAAIAGLAALVIIHFDTIKRWISNTFNWVRDHWPLLLTILTGPIGAAVVLIVKHWDKIWGAGKAVFGWIKRNWPLLLAIITGPIGLAALAIARNWDKIKAGATSVKNWIRDRFNDVVRFVTGLPGRISRAASNMWDGIKSAFKNVLNAIIRWWNGLQFPSITVGGQDPFGDFGPSLPSVTIGGWDLPNIPELHSGGVFRAPPGESEGLALLKDRETVLAPSVGVSPSGSGAAPAGRLVIDVTGGTDDLAKVIRTWVRNNHGGDVQVALGTG